MKNRLLNIIFAGCTAVAALACARIEELENVPQIKRVAMTFSAVVDDNTDAETKTVLDGKLGESYRMVLWQPGDTIAIRNDYEGQYCKFINTQKEISSEGSFSGEIYQYTGEHVAFYPYRSDLEQGNYNLRNIWFFQPSVQKFQENSFASGAMPMIALYNNSTSSAEMKFRNLFGVLAVNMIGTETIKTLSFSGMDNTGVPIQVAGHFMATIGSDKTTVSHSPAGTEWGKSTISTISLDCGEGVTLDPGTPTAFYIALPPETYHSFNLVITTTDGKTMLKHMEKPLTITRANVTKTGSLPYVEVTIPFSAIVTYSGFDTTKSKY